MAANQYDLTDGRAGVQLGTDTKTHKLVYLPYADRDLGVAYIGKSGTGKSSQLEYLVLADLEVGTPGMVIDLHGVLAQRVIELATPEQRERIILLEAAQRAPFGLNLLAVREPVDKDDLPEARAVDAVLATFKKLYGEDDSFLPRFERYLRLCVRTLIPSRLTLLDLPRLFDDLPFRESCLRRVTDPTELQNLQRGWARYDRMRASDQETHTEALVNRLDGLLDSPVIRQIIGSPETTVPFDRILDGNTMLLVSLPSDRLSPERCDFIGTLLLCALADLIFARSVQNETPPRLHMYLDEYQRIATSTTATLLEQGRKYGAGVTLAHQTLYQIRDQRIRNAARHAGTLVVLGVTRPDAEELAGEFPITPKEEWIETVEEIDGTEPVYVFNPTPADHLRLNPHDDPDVDLAARSFFPGPQLRPGGIEVADRVKVDTTVVQPFLVRAMAGELSTNELFADALIEPHAKIVQGSDSTRPRAVFSWLENCSPALTRGTHDSWCMVGLPLGSQFQVGGRITGSCNCRIGEREWAAIPENEEIERIFQTCVPEHLERIREWLLVCLEDRKAVRAGRMTEAIITANSALLVRCGMYYWDGIWNWANPLTDTPEGTRKPHMCIFPEQLLDRGIAICKEDQDKVNAQRWKEHKEAFRILRERLRWLVILAEGLERSPLRVPSGEYKPRRTKRHIVHGAQTHADALNEVAGKLVHPPQRYVAHVRQLEEYHPVKLRPPLEGETDSGLVDLVRERSRKLYTRPPARRAEDPALPADTSRPSPPITRRPPVTPPEPPQEDPTDEESGNDPDTAS